MSQQLQRTIDRVAENASLQMAAAGRERYLREHVGGAVVMLAAVPIVAVAFQAIRWLLGLPAGFGFSWPWLIGLSLAFPIVWVLAATLWKRIDVSRQQALGAMDEQLGSSERLVTADEFLTQPDRDAYRNAAIEDAEQWVSKARAERLESSVAAPVVPTRSLIAIPIAALALAAAWWLAGQSGAAAAKTADASPKPDRRSPGEVDPAAATERTASQTSTSPPRVNGPSRPGAQRRPQRRENRLGTATVVTADDAQPSRGQLSDGQTSESQRSSNPSSARGQPSASGQPSKADQPTPKKSSKPRNKEDDKRRPATERKDQDEPSGSTAGQGSSRGSNNNAAASDWSSKSQAATPDNEDIEDEDDVDDEDEEQESRGGVQPNMRDRRTPTNRDLQIGFGSNRPNPDANGRGGPSGQKKSRGVASLVLGVPIPDRISGQPNKGRVRITQQRINPEAEQNDAVLAEARMTREDAVGRVAHPEFAPWLQDVVREYFLDRRAANPLKTNDAPKTNSSDQTQMNLPAAERERSAS